MLAFLIMTTNFCPLGPNELLTLVEPTFKTHAQRPEPGLSSDYAPIPAAHDDVIFVVGIMSSRHTPSVH